jgi:putative transposase
MARKRYKPEEIVAKLRQVDVLVSQGQNMVDAIRQIGVSEVTGETSKPRASPRLH